jgi:hypothetical protein
MRSNQGRREDGSLRLQYHTLNPNFLRDVAALFTHGALKYDDPNHTKETRSLEAWYSAALGHLLEWRRGTTIDPETGLPVLAHIAACIHALYELSAVASEGRCHCPICGGDVGQPKNASAEESRESVSAAQSIRDHDERVRRTIDTARGFMPSVPQAPQGDTLSYRSLPPEALSVEVSTSSPVQLADGAAGAVRRDRGAAAEIRY